MSVRAGLLIALVAVMSFSFSLSVGAWAQPPGTAAESNARRIDLQDLDAVVAGTVDRSGAAWVLARQRQGESLVLYRILPDGSSRRTVLPLQSAGVLAAIAVAADGTLWVGAGARVARIDPASGRTTKSIDLTRPSSVVSTALRAPDGTVLGWGQVTNIAVDDVGSAWVARYAVPELLRVDAAGNTDAIALPDTDASTLVTGPTGLWFTTNFGSGQQLGARVGVLERASRSVRLVNVTAAAIVPTLHGIEALGAGRTRIDPATLTTFKGNLPSRTLSLAAVAADARGNLMARLAKQNRLLVFDDQGRSLRAIDFEAGSFQTRGRLVSMVAPLAMLSIEGSGLIWLAPRGASSVYVAR